MDFIIDAIVEWLKGLLVDGIMGNLDGLFDNVNQSVGEIATQVGTTPADWNAGVFSMIRQISETAILPIAGVILTFVMTSITTSSFSFIEFRSTSMCFLQELDLAPPSA